MPDTTNTVPADNLFYENPKFKSDETYNFQPSHYLVKSKVSNFSTGGGRGRGRQQPPPQQLPFANSKVEEEVDMDAGDDVVMEEPREPIAENSAEVIGPDSIRAREMMKKVVLSILARSPPSSMIKADIYSGSAGIAFLFHKLHLLDPLLSFSLEQTSPSIPCIQIAKLYIDKSISILSTPSFNNPKSYQCGFASSYSGVYALAAVGTYFSIINNL
jgi:hypothetical protein